MATIDFNAMTLDEVEQIEQLTGRGIDSIMAEGSPRGRAFKAIIFVMSKRTNPNFTFEDAGKLSLEEAAALFGGEDDPKVLEKNKLEG
jgi:hypothetical protein